MTTDDSESNCCPKCLALLGQDDFCYRCAARGLDTTYFRDSSRAAVSKRPVIDGWDVKELLSAGGMGEIWLAQNDEFTAALKLPAARLANQTEVIRRFEMEAEVLASLDHPNIVRVLDIGLTQDGRLFIATEYIEGCDLARLLKAERLPRERALDIFSKACEAIEYAHGQKIIHRDLKPANLLVSADGTVKLADFGLAKQLGDDSTAMRTSQGDGLGTPYYLAPEALRNASSADERADVYSLGVLLYELLSGKLPLGTYQPLSSLGFSKSLDSIIRRALQQSPADRYPEAQELHQAVLRLRKKQENASRRKHWQNIGLGTLALAAAAGLGVHFGATPDPSPPVTITHPDPHTAEIGQAWTNSLGMEFLPVPNYENLLMCRTETSLGEFLIFREAQMEALALWYRSPATGEIRSGANRFIFTPQGWRESQGRDFQELGFPQSNDSPVGSVTGTEAETFCNWLTLRERAEGRISATQFYRLPTVGEWQTACASSSLEDSNFAREEAANSADWPQGFRSSPGKDPHIFSAPVSSGEANDDGFFHLAGNHFEWVTQNKEDQNEQVIHRFGRIGGSWATPIQQPRRPQHKGNTNFAVRRADHGFRCVLELNPQP